MCTVVVRWSEDQPVLVLALRDEVVGRAFDEPAAWWPETPDTVAGRDRQGGGTWCATDVASGRTALVLNRPPRPVAAAGAPSRGVLPLLAVQHGERWSDAVDVAGMASFALVLAGPDALVLWEYDGERLTGRRLPAGVQVLTSGGAEDGAERHLPALLDDVSPQGWQRVVTGSRVADDATALLVARLAKLRGISKQDAVKLAVRAELNRAEEAVPLRDRFAALRAAHPLPPGTGEAADKAFFDALSGEP